ncbi:MAG: hypothetical protein ABI426_06130 [Flavobacterium sp.]
MKKVIIILALFMLFKPVFPVIEYVINYDYISKVLCVNKDKPAMKCNGKCHLMKELAKASEGEKSNSNDKKSTHFESEILFFETIKPLVITQICFSTEEKIHNNYANLYAYLAHHSVFHPPTFIS